MDRKQRQQIVFRIGDLLEHHCKSCDKGKGKSETQRNAEHCGPCEVGQELKKLGNLMQKKREGRAVILTNKELNIENYKLWKKQGLTDKQIMRELEIDKNKLYRFKRENDLIDKYDAKRKDQAAVKEDKQPKPSLKQPKKPIIVQEEKKVETNFETALDEILSELRTTLIQKNAHYGNSFFNQIDEWGPAAIMIPIANKTDRLRSLYRLDSEPIESIKDSHLDAAGYNVLTLVYKKLRG